MLTQKLVVYKLCLDFKFRILSPINRKLLVLKLELERLSYPDIFSERLFYIIYAINGKFVQIKVHIALIMHCIDGYLNICIMLLKIGSV